MNESWGDMSTMVAFEFTKKFEANSGPSSTVDVSSGDSSSYRRLSCRFPSFRYPFCWRLIRF